MHKHGTTLDSFFRLESTTSLAETVPMTGAMELEPNNSNSSMSDSTVPTVPSLSSSLDVTPLHRTLRGQTPFTNAVLMGPDMSTMTVMNTSQDDMSMNESFMNTWFDGDTLMSPSTSPTAMPYLLDTELEPSIETPVLSELVQADL